MASATTVVGGVLTGVNEVDGELGGGIPAGSLVLIEGQTGTGKSVLCQHLAYGALCSGEHSVAYYATDSSIKSLITQMDSLSLYALDYLLTGWLSIYPMNLRNGYRAAREALILLAYHLSKLPERFSLVVLDSLTLLMTHIDPAAKLDFFCACKELCERGRTMLIVAESRAFEKGMLSRICSLCDDHLRLGSEEVGCRMLKSLQALRLRGVDYPGRKGISFEVNLGAGIQILPYAKIAASPK